ncbi:hypothetical protein EKQ44_07800 [Sutcliffiella horikoshii]|nr:hypothetical protein [Sutcliffiella horikoshii]
MEHKPKTPAGGSARSRPRRLAEEAQAPPRGKQSLARKSTAVFNRAFKIRRTYVHSNNYHITR